jgi:hypothetical protein
MVHQAGSILNDATIAVLQTVFTKLKVVRREEISPMVLGKCAGRVSSGGSHTGI